MHIWRERNLLSIHLTVEGHFEEWRYSIPSSV